jgi:hypothetical protein
LSHASHYGNIDTGSQLCLLGNLPAYLLITVKVNLFLKLLIRFHTGKVEVQLYIFLIYTPRGGYRETLHPLILRANGLHANLTGDGVCCTAGVDGMQKRKVACHYLQSNHDSSVVRCNTALYRIFFLVKI